MKINKVTTGFVVQVFDTKIGKYVSQSFIAADPVDYESEKGESLSSTFLESFGIGPNTTEPYFPFDMVQPDSKTKLDSCREQIQNDLLCLLDNYPNEVKDKACQIVVDNFQKLK
jgi:hypothetical protein